MRLAFDPTSAPSVHRPRPLRAAEQGGGGLLAVPSPSRRSSPPLLACVLHVRPRMLHAQHPMAREQGRPRCRPTPLPSPLAPPVGNSKSVLANAPLRILHKARMGGEGFPRPVARGVGGPSGKRHRMPSRVGDPGEAMPSRFPSPDAGGEDHLYHTRSTTIQWCGCGWRCADTIPRRPG